MDDLPTKLTGLTEVSQENVSIQSLCSPLMISTKCVCGNEETLTHCKIVNARLYLVFPGGPAGSNR